MGMPNELLGSKTPGPARRRSRIVTGEVAPCNEGWEGTTTHEGATVRLAIAGEGDKDGIWRVEFGCGEA